MNYWFRVYNSMVDDPKVQQLPDALFKALINLWCLASQNDGVLPPSGDVAFKLRVNLSKAAEIITKLVRAGLIDNDAGVFRPHNWGSRQFKSDGSTERVQRFRERQKVTAEADEPKQDQSRVESESEQSTAELIARAALEISEKVLRTDIMEIFGASKCPDLTRCGVWLAKGYERPMIREVVTELLARKPDISSLAYFDAALAERHAKRPETPSERAAAAASYDMDWAVGMFAKGGAWPRKAGPEPGQVGCRASIEVLAKHGLGPDGQKIKK